MRVMALKDQFPFIFLLVLVATPRGKLFVSFCCLPGLLKKSLVCSLYQTKVHKTFSEVQSKEKTCNYLVTVVSCGKITPYSHGKMPLGWT